MDYKQQYLKYKNKYLNLKTQSGGTQEDIHKYLELDKAMTEETIEVDNWYFYVHKARDPERWSKYNQVLLPGIKQLVKVVKIEDGTESGVGHKKYTLSIPVDYSSDDKSIMVQTLQNIYLNNSSWDGSYNSFYSIKDIKPTYKMNQIAIHYNRWSKLEQGDTKSVLKSVLQQLDNMTLSK
jgi:hypothetical protein